MTDASCQLSILLLKKLLLYLVNLTNYSKTITVKFILTKNKFCELHLHFLKWFLLKYNYLYMIRLKKYLITDMKVQRGGRNFKPHCTDCGFKPQNFN